MRHGTLDEYEPDVSQHEDAARGIIAAASTEPRGSPGALAARELARPVVESGNRLASELATWERETPRSAEKKRAKDLRARVDAATTAIRRAVGIGGWSLPDLAGGGALLLLLGIAYYMGSRRR
jgi:hypothetical protein